MPYSGGDSSFGTIVAVGGGYGGNWYSGSTNAGGDGGSGGGGQSGSSNHAGGSGTTSNISYESTVNNYYHIGTQPDSATNPLAIIDELHVHSAPAETVVAKSHDRGDAEFNLVDTVPFATEGATITSVSYTHLTLPTTHYV